MLRIIITTLAEYQTHFWIPVGLQLRCLGYDVEFISFDDKSTEMLRKVGIDVHPATDLTQGSEDLDLEFEYGISGLNYWLGHERIAFGLQDSNQMILKLRSALIYADRVCAAASCKGKTVMLQELGGFLSVIGCYFAARKYGIDNWFVEPSFFRGRLFLLRNSFSAISIKEPISGPVSVEVNKYLDDTILRGTIVIPIKDRHQYAATWKKIFNQHNINRLFLKLYNKYILKKHFEFGYIRNHVLTHLSMLWNCHRLSSYYTPLNSISDFVYFPLHVPGDMALTLRSPQYLNQIALIEFLCRSVPFSHKVVIKEHPAMVGAINSNEIIRLLRRYDNLILLPASTNNFDVLNRSDAVISINSKSGAEAALIGKPVIVLGDAFYSKSPLVHALDRIQDLPVLISNVLSERKKIDKALIRSYFASVWECSFPGELYYVDNNNIVIFCNSLLSALD